ELGRDFCLVDSSEEAAHVMAARLAHVPGVEFVGFAPNGHRSTPRQPALKVAARSGRTRSNSAGASGII
ncbi:MAG TPA: hypothetical protein VGR88_06600, partial [Ktedonobacterales bacterium]|nr:hypothetical protein [Ktedonobacterales bacterium]